MTTLMENPVPIIVIGLLVVAVLAIVWVSTRRGSLLLAMLGVASLTLGGVFLERIVVTEREEVEIAVDRIATLLEANDWDRLRSECILGSATSTIARTHFAERLVRVTDTSIHNLQIELLELTSPPTAEVRFDGVIYYEGKGVGDVIGAGRYPAKFTFTFERHEDRWLVGEHVEQQIQRP